MSQFRKAVVITGEWECMECGYTEEGTELRPPKKCPECDAPANALEFFAHEDDDDFDWDRAPYDEDEDEDNEDYDDEE